MEQRNAVVGGIAVAILAGIIWIASQDVGVVPAAPPGKDISSHSHIDRIAAFVAASGERKGKGGEATPVPLVTEESAIQGSVGEEPFVPATGVSLLSLLPPLWHSGDTHAHIQQCGMPAPSDLTPDELLTRQISSEAQVTFAQVWGIRESDASFLSEYAPLVTGSEHPVSASNPDYDIQFGLEVSEFPGSADQLGHASCAGIASAAFPASASYPKQVLDFCRGQQGAIAGYAHVFAPESYNVQEYVFSPSYGLIGYTAPIDASLGTVDFIEANETAASLTATWRGMYYKLLNAGVRLAIVSGRDNSCSELPENETTFAKIDSAPLTFEKWTQAIKAGRTSIAEGKKFLSVTVNGIEPGGQTALASAGNVDVSINFVSAENHTGTITIVQDGTALSGSYPYTVTAGVPFTVAVPVPVAKSGWIAARAVGADGNDAHTGAVYVIVGNQPICNSADAAYWSAYDDALAANANVFSFSSPADQQGFLANLATSKKIFDALNACAVPPPAGVTRMFISTPACKGPIQISTRGGAPVPGNANFGFTAINAPPSASGWFVLATNLASAPIPFNGASIFLDPTSLIMVNTVTANSGGFAEYTIPIPAGAPAGFTVYAQFVFANTGTCGGAGTLSASDAVKVTIQ